MQIRQLRELKSKMSEEQKRKLLIGLYKLKDGIVGANNTDISNPDNFQVNENEFTARMPNKERNPVAKTFETKSDFYSYVSQRRGIEITPTEIQSLTTNDPANSTAQQPQPQPQYPQQPQPQPSIAEDTIRITKTVTYTDEIDGANLFADLLIELELKNQTPTEKTKYYIKYEITDSFGKNQTTIIKKLMEGNLFCWTAFSKYESADKNITGDKEKGNPNP